ncbi:MAG: hypothetical protein MI749_11700, partial [Desulfovibrionales bacterium]|nr:hypothetical protein [Desulfovibrionales bacterium]
MAVDRLYYASMDPRQKVVGERLDFGGCFDMAGGADGAESANAYRAMSESIYRNMGMVDDADGYYTDCLVESIENMAESVLQLEDKREHTEYLATMMAEAPPDLSRHYRSALETVCVSGAELDHLYGFLQTLLDGGDREPGQIVEITRMQIHILEERDGDHTGEIVRRLEGTYRLAPELRVKHIEYLERADAAEARGRAMQMVKEFPDDAGVAEAALGMCGKSDPEYATLSLGLFVSTGDWKYYARIKESPSWSAADTVRSLVDMGENQKAVEACIKEKMHDEGMDILESAKHLGLLGRFAERLGKKYPERYYDAYAPLIRSLALRKARGKARGLEKVPVRFFKRLGGAQATDQKHNERVRDHLL